MYTTSRVIEIKDKNTVLVGCSTEACKGCKAEMFCNNKNDNSFLVRNDDLIELHEGDQVELFMPPGKTIGSTALVFALPLALFPIGYLLTKNLFNKNEIINALGGIALMAVAFGISSFIFSKNKRALMPIITGKLDC